MSASSDARQLLGEREVAAEWPSAHPFAPARRAVEHGPEVERAYRAERRELQAARTTLTYSVVLFFAVFSTALEYFSYPARRRIMLAAFSGFAFTCVATIVAVRRRPQWAVPASVLANNLLILFTALYYVPSHGSPEACALTLVLFLAALPLLNGAGALVQALSCLGAIVGYGLVLATGDPSQLPVSYGITAILGATGVTVLGANLLDRQRLVAFRSREALRGSEENLRGILERYRALYENNPVMYFTVEADGTVRSVNRFGAEQLGYRADELVGRTVLSVFFPEDRADIESQLQRCIERVGDVAHWECQKVRKDGRVLWVRESARALRESDGRVVVLIVCEDATERKQAEAAARRHQAELAHVGRVSLMGEMAAGLAHELNQPLAAIVNFTRGCEHRLRASGADGEILDALGEVSTQALRAGEIIRRVRLFIRKEEPSFAWADLNDLVRNVARLVDADGRQQGIRIQLALTPSVPKVYVDTIQIEQVLLNLMRNGIDAMDGETAAEKTLSIRTEASDDARVDVAVCDTGSGLASDLVDRVFDPFFSTKRAGLGLGLSISRSIVEAHGGRLWVEPNPTGGSTFRFSLAAARPLATQSA